MSVYLLYQSVILLGWEDGRIEGEATKGCKLIRFLSLHAPLPVLLLSNPGGQRCAAQRLDSQTQWGNNWYKQHLAAETLSVIQSDTVSPLPPVFYSQSAFSLIQKLFIHCTVTSFIPSFYQSFFWTFTKWQLSLTVVLLSDCPLLIATRPLLLVFALSCSSVYLLSFNLMLMSVCYRTLHYCVDDSMGKWVV